MTKIVICKIDIKKVVVNTKILIVINLFKVYLLLTKKLNYEKVIYTVIYGTKNGLN